jgi:Arm DNA-binding domain
MASFQKYQTKDGWKWLFKVDLPPDPLTGKRRQTTRRGFKTKKEAQKAATELLMQAEKGVEVINQNMTLEEYLDKWVDLSAKRKVRETTLKIICEQLIIESNPF